MDLNTQDQIREIITSLEINDEVFCAHTGVSLIDLSGSGDESATLRLRAVIEVFNRVESWFDSSTEAWAWFTSKCNPPLKSE